jgi:hypothetical protein
VFWPYLWPLPIRRGRKPAGISPGPGLPMRSVSVGTSRTDGTIDATERIAVASSFTAGRGGLWGDQVILLTLPRVSSFGEPISFGPGTAARGVSGQQPDSAA